jgi:hypothetical protein
MITTRLQTSLFKISYPFLLSTNLPEYAWCLSREPTQTCRWRGYEPGVSWKKFARMNLPSRWRSRLILSPGRWVVAISEDQLMALEKRTEGWAAGLQLAALSMRTTEDVSGFIEAFSGGHEYIADYLADEVLAQQSDQVKTFLLQTSILERFSASLCAAVTQDEDAPNILETLRERNLFLIPLDHHKEWYRYHALFVDLLRNRLRQSYAGQVDELYLRASQWCQETIR